MILKKKIIKKGFITNNNKNNRYQIRHKNKLKSNAKGVKLETKFNQKKG